MKIEINEDREFILKDVYSGVGLETDSGETFGICMRDGGFEFNYGGCWWEAKRGSIQKLCRNNSVTTDGTPYFDIRNTISPYYKQECQDQLGDGGWPTANTNIGSLVH